MKTITVNASKSYDVVIGTKLLDGLGHYASTLCKGQKAAIISDSNVWPVYGARATDSLERSGFTTCNFVFSAGEESKTGATYLEILNFLADNRLTRSDIIIALGGGVVGDIAGFASATFLRGIPFIQVPTSLLAMVDSSVGGKTAIDLPGGKNLAGAFYQPSLVLCDLDVLESLPDEIFQDGCAEVIKYGVLYDPVLFSHLAEHGIAFDREAVIARCVELKRNVVIEDEFDTGARQLLNLGHTVGHAIEARSHFTVRHGQAVAIGMCIISKAGEASNITVKGTYDQILKVMKRFHLPYCTALSADELYDIMLSDKKRFSDTVNLIIPQKIGECRIHPVSVTELKRYIKAGL